MNKYKKKYSYRRIKYKKHKKHLTVKHRNKTRQRHTQQKITKKITKYKENQKGGFMLSDISNVLSKNRYHRITDYINYFSNIVYKNIPYEHVKSYLYTAINNISFQIKRNPSLYVELNNILDLLMAYKYVNEYWVQVYDNYDFTPFQTTPLKKYFSNQEEEITYYYQLIFTYYTIIAKLISDDYILLLKGGKSLEMHLNYKCPDIKSSDIDLILISKSPSTEQDDNDMCRKITYLILWFSLSENIFPFITKNIYNSKIWKISHPKMTGGIIAISDISYGYATMNSSIKNLYNISNIEKKEIDTNVTTLLNESITKQGVIYMQPLKYILYEKLYYLDYYIRSKNISPNNTYYMDKSIKYMALIILCMFNDKNEEILEKLKLDIDSKIQKFTFFKDSFSSLINKYINVSEDNYETVKDCYVLLSYIYVGYNKFFQTTYQEKQYHPKHLIIEEINKILISK